MAFVRVEQRNARLAAGVRLDTVQGKEGPLTKGTAVAISNVRKGGEGREEETTSILWTFWGKLAENAAEYLSKGSRVNIVGRLQNNNYKGADGELVYGLTFTCEEIDYLDSRQEAEARRAGQKADAGGATSSGEAAPARAKSKAAASPRNGKAAKAVADDDIPF